MSKIENAREIIANAVRRNLTAMFPGYFPDQKHSHYTDYGWPDAVTFEQLHSMFKRNSIAKAAVNKTTRKVFETAPALREADQGEKETQTEAEIRKRFQKLGVWRAIAETHRRSLVGKYAGAIIRIGDGKPFSDPVERAPGLEALVEIIPAWQAQLTASEWDTNPASETYGKPTMYQFNESAVGNDAKAMARSFDVHPDRVVIFSDDGSVNGSSILEAGYNDLMDMEKIKGAGGEGFWKNAKSAPVLEIDKEAKLGDMASAMGVDDSELLEAMNEQVGEWQKGFDKLLMLQGIQAKTLPATLADPEPPYNVSLQSFAASIEMPVKILVGMQTGERASKEDAEEWARTAMGRRNESVIPAIMELIDRLERFGILPEADWWLDWADLTEAGMPERIDRASKMADINAKSMDSLDGELIFTGDEIRDAAGFEALGDALDYHDSEEDE